MIQTDQDFFTDKSIAVLPFVNMSGDPENEYFSDGITEEIINALTTVDGLKVIARTSSFAFKGKHIDIRLVGKELGVTSVLEGSVRKAQNRVRITAQLINANDGTHFWSRNFDRELNDIFSLQDEVSLLIADQIRENFGHLNIQDHLVKSPTPSVKAYELLLRGRFHQLKWHPESFREAISYYDAAIRIDDRFARAYYGNVQCYGLLGIWGYMPLEEALEKATGNLLIAKDIDTRLPEYNLSFIGRSLWAEWDYPNAYQQICELLQLSPDFTDGLEAMAELLMANGYFKEAEKYVRKAMVVDPLSANHYYTLANLHYLQSNFETALTHLQKSLSLNPELEPAFHLQLLCLIRLNEQKEFETLISGREDAELPQLLFSVFNGQDKIEIPPEKRNKWMQASDDRNQIIPYELYILAGSDHTKEALELLTGYVNQRRGQLMYFRQEPFLTPLHRFEDFHNLFQTDFVLPEHQPDNKSRDPKIDPAELEKLMTQVQGFITEEQPYLDAQLSLSSLARETGLHPSKLSLIINEQTGKNFNEFINGFRLEHFKKIARHPGYRHMTILGLALESGFNSKSVFNTFFKKTEGKTPAGWMKSVKD